jgi:ubiquinone/menaquinone biosynthesis C-methylase UbiE
VVTVALAQWSGGIVTGIDIDERALQRLAQHAEQAGVTEKVTIIKKSMKAMNFPKESFDIIWAEGAIAVVGFKRGLKTWKRFLKPGGYMVIHDDGQHIPQKQQQVGESGYTLIESFFLDEQVWWDEYYGPLALRIDEFKADAKQDPALAAKLASSQREIDGYHEQPESYCSIFFILQRQ